jgi:hypothetical protein
MRLSAARRDVGSVTLAIMLMHVQRTQDFCVHQRHAQQPDNRNDSPRQLHDLSPEHQTFGAYRV